MVRAHQPKGPDGLSMTGPYPTGPDLGLPDLDVANRIPPRHTEPCLTAKRLTQENPSMANLTGPHRTSPDLSIPDQLLTQAGRTPPHQSIADRAAHYPSLANTTEPRCSAPDLSLTHQAIPESINLNRETGHLEASISRAEVSQPH